MRIEKQIEDLESYKFLKKNNARYMIFNTETTGRPKYYPSNLKTFPRLTKISWVIYGSNNKELISKSYTVTSYGIKNILQIFRDYAIIIQEQYPSYLITYDVKWNCDVLNAEFLREKIYNPIPYFERVCLREYLTLIKKNRKSLRDKYKHNKIELSHLFYQLFNTNNIRTDFETNSKMISMCFIKLKELKMWNALTKWDDFSAGIWNQKQRKKKKSEKRILFFDTETTGLPKDWKASVTNLNNWPRLVQLAWLIYDASGKLITTENHIIKPEGFTIPKEASKIHNITTEKAILEGVKLKKILSKFFYSLEQADIIVAHNLEFDKNVMGSEFIRNNFNNIIFSKKSYCTMINNTELFNGKWPKLKELHFNLFNEYFNEHNAIDDVKATARCYWKLINNLDIKTYKVTPSDLKYINNGTIVKHSKFGEGFVVSITEELDKDDMKAIINFNSSGIKTLLLKYAKLEIIKD